MFSPTHSARAALAALALPALLALAAAPASAARPTARWIAGAELRADVAVLRRTFERLHPGLYRYTSRARMGARFAALDRRLAHGATLPRAYLAVTQFTAAVACGHTYPNPLNQPRAVRTAVLESAPRVPFWFRWIGGRMIVTRSFGPARLALGTEVLALDGVPAGAVLRRLLSVARADGSNDAKRVSDLEVRGAGEYEAFDVYYPLFYPLRPDRLDLRVRAPGRTAARTLAVRPLTFAERVAPVRARTAAAHGGSEPLWAFRFLGPRTAYLRMPTWAVFDTRWNWKRFLARALDETVRRHAANLVIDLRGNEGGADVGDEILARLTARPLHVAQYRRLVRYRRVPAGLRPYLHTWDASFADWGAAAVPFDARFYRLTKYDDDTGGNLIRPLGPEFRGHTYVLVDAANSSATFQFAQVVQQRHLATLVGTPTGGNRRGIDGGAFFFLTLPRSGIEVDLPLIGFYPPGAQPDAGLRPDLLVPQTAAAVAHGVDPELRFLAARLAKP